VLDQQIAASSDPATAELLQQQKRDAEEEKAAKVAEEESRKRAIGQCKEQLKESMDDRFNIPNYDLGPYKASSLPKRESQNSIATIMSAMVSQIA
jgi:hypothetical protein